MSFLTRFLNRAMSTSPSNTTSSATTQGVPLTGSLQKATVAAGCFWGVEHAYRHAFTKQQIPDLLVGYIGGSPQDTKPSYRSVCSGTTGHAEALQMSFDPTKVSYKTLIEFFYKMHDPTTKDRQGPDTGSQYRSAIFAHGDEQFKVAAEVTRKVGEQWWKPEVATQVVDAEMEGLKWWNAEDYHQEYLQNNPSGYECPSHFVRQFPELQ